MNKHIPSQIQKWYAQGYNALIYMVGFNSAAGLGNGIGSQQFKEGFGEGYVNHFKGALIVSPTYPLVLNQLKKISSSDRQYKVLANTYHTGVSLSFLAWHFYSGTHDPISTMIPTALAGYAMVNGQISQETIDTKVNL